MKRNGITKLYMNLRCLLSGLSFPIEDSIFSCDGADCQGALAQSRVGDKLQIVHTEFSKNAFAAMIYNVEINRLLGKIGGQLTQDLLKIFKKGFVLDGEIAQLTQENEKFRCHIRVFKTSSLTEEQLALLPYLTFKHNE